VYRTQKLTMVCAIVTDLYSLSKLPSDRSVARFLCLCNSSMW